MQTEVSNVKEIRAKTGMSQKKFAEYFDIPFRTIQDWEQGRRIPAPYVPKMMERILNNEFYANTKERGTAESK